MSEKYYTKETGWTEAGIKEQERRSDLTKLTAEELLSGIQPRSEICITARQEVRRRLERLAQCDLATAQDKGQIAVLKERLEQCEATLKRYADKTNWAREGNCQNILWICTDEDAWEGPDAARAALEGK